MRSSIPSKNKRHPFEALSGKRVLITGDSGFKGTWLVQWLRMLEAEVIGVSLEPRATDVHFKWVSSELGSRHINLDIRNANAVLKVFEEFKPEIVFHLAAQALVRESYRDPVETFSTNFSGSLNILEAVRHTPSVRSFVFVTSDKCYRNKEWVWGYRETDELGGKDPYSASKASAELLFYSYRASFFDARNDFGCASVRAGNVIGGGDFSVDRIVPDCIKALSSTNTIVLRSPHATRPWQHVLEPLSGYLQTATCLLQDPKKYSGSWNFGPLISSNRSVKELVESMYDVWGADRSKIQIDKTGGDNLAQEAQLLHLNCDKAFHQLGWAPTWDFETTIQKTVAWYKTAIDSVSAIQISRQQILEYTGDLRLNDPQ